MRVIGYGSRTLTPAERNYRLYSKKLEFLALKWAICEQFRDYLYYAPSFTVYTDNNPLTYVLSTAKLNSTGHCWLSELADYNFDITYRPGKVNRDADTLSRLPMDIDQYMPSCTQETSQEVISATLSGVMALQHGGTVWITTVSDKTETLDLDLISLILGNMTKLSLMSSWRVKNDIQVLVEYWHTNWMDVNHLPVKFVENFRTQESCCVSGQSWTLEKMGC